jgi:hypothetical protein
MLKWLWPQVNTLPLAHEACRQSAFACLFLTLGTLLMVAGGQIPQEHYVGALLFVFLALGTYRGLRSAAIAALLLFCMLSAPRLLLDRSHLFTGGALALFLFLALITGVRGAFAFRRLSRQAKTIAASGSSADKKTDAA